MRFGIRDITDVVFKARTRMKIGNQTFQAGQPIIYIDTAKTATVEGAATQVYAQGGHGNPRLVAWEGERTVTFTLEDALLSPESFSLLSGALVSKAASDNKIKIGTWFELPIKEGGVVEIDLDTAGDDHDIYVDAEFPMFGVILDDAGAPAVHCGEQVGLTGVEPNCNVYTITRDNKLVVTFNGADKYVGRTMRVDCYVEKSAGVTQLDVTATDFSGNFYVEALTFFREEASGVDMPVFIIFPNVKIQSNFTLTMAASGDPSTFTFTMDCFPGYVKGDYTRKVFFSTRMTDYDTFTGVDSEALECPELEFAFTGVTAGTNGWTTTEFPEDPQKVNFASLGRNLSATIDRANIDFSGTLNHIANWDAFSSNEADLTGYYFPFKMEAENGSKFVMNTPAGNEKTSVFGETGDGEGVICMVMAVNPDAPVMTATLTDAESSKSTVYSLDFSGCNFA